MRYSRQEHWSGLPFPSPKLLRGHNYVTLFLSTWAASVSQSVQSLSQVRLFATPWIAACQASLSSLGLCKYYVLSTQVLIETPAPHPPLYSLLSSHHDPSSSFTNKQSSFLPQDLSTSYLLFSLPEILVPLSLTLMTLSDFSGLAWNGSSSESPFQNGLDPSHSPDSYFSK